MNTTSYANLFGQGFEVEGQEAVSINGIEIPIIQRDYAQGRQEPAVRAIRERFLGALHGAVTGGKPENLDFVYGQVSPGGKLIPLDGQQRLTTLFLLHWYLAARAGVDVGGAGWRAFSYETRVSSGEFCAALTRLRPFPLPASQPVLSGWIQDQSWYFLSWNRDPTIACMLVMLDDIHALFAQDDCNAAWARLTDPKNPALSFHFLPIARMGLTDDLYIKMNSRGRPLTAFENFKAAFEQILEEADEADYREFTRKVDNDWAQLLWPLREKARGAGVGTVSNVVDDEFMRYFVFVTEVLWHRSDLRWPGLPDSAPSKHGTMEALAVMVYGKQHADPKQAAENRRFLFSALDCWCTPPAAAGDPPAASRGWIDVWFKAAFALDGHDVDNPNKVALYSRGGHAMVNLFHACCKAYPQRVHQLADGKDREFSLAGTLMLYAVTLHLTEHTAAAADNLRLVRNLVEASDVRVEQLGSLLRGVGTVMRDGLPPGTTSLGRFDKRQLAEERDKADLITANPGLRTPVARLEDHPLLRGCLNAFDLKSPLVFAARARAFEEVFAPSVPGSLVTGALLAAGDYSFLIGGNHFQFGSASRREMWRTLFTGADRPRRNPMREVLATLLDAIKQAEPSRIEAQLARYAAAFCEDAEARAEFEWRYYLVKYPAMREGLSGGYVGANGAMGPLLCMMNGTAMNGYFRDPYLLAVVRHVRAANPGVRLVGTQWLTDEDPWHTGYESTPRWLTDLWSGVRLRFAETSIMLEPPTRLEFKHGYAAVLNRHGAVDGAIAIPQSTSAAAGDAVDRVALGAAIVRDLLEMRRT